MKSFFIFCFFIILSWVGMTPVGVFASSPGKNPEHASTEKILDFSLSRLKESVEKNVQRNNRLSYENHILRESIAQMKRKRDGLYARLAKLTGGGASRRESGNSVPDLRALSAEESIERARRTRELIGLFTEEVARLETALREIDPELNEQSKISEHRALVDKKKTLKKAVSQAKGALAGWQRRNSKPRQVIKALQQEQMTLNQKICDLERRGPGPKSLFW